MNEKLDSSQDKILYQIKRLGPLPAKVLADRLGMTTMGVRQHLAQLEADGLIQSGEPAPQKRGRPISSWSLTDSGHARFPDAHAQVTMELITSVRDELGEAALDKIINARAAQTLKHYRQELSGIADLEARVVKLARLRTDEGYMAEALAVSDDIYRLIEHHCPICIAAQTCQGFCRAELDTFEDLFKDVASVNREEFLLDGARRCSYTITRHK